MLIWSGGTWVNMQLIHANLTFRRGCITSVWDHSITNLTDPPASSDWIITTLRRCDNNKELIPPFCGWIHQQDAKQNFILCTFPVQSSIFTNTLGLTLLIKRGNKISEMVIIWKWKTESNGGLNSFATIIPDASGQFIIKCIFIIAL